MGIDIKITNKLDNNCVQVEVNSNKGGQSKYFKVPVDKADSFIANYKKNDKNTSFITNTAFVSSIFGGVLLSSLATKKFIKSGTLRWIINTLAGIASATGSVVASSNYIESRNNKLLKQHNAQQIYYQA